MQYSKLGNTDINISRVCLGSMTWGTQNSQTDANEQIEFALANGINFIDTAEMYAVPPSKETYGKTESIIGTWIAANSKRRQEFILATKIAGNGLSWIRNGADINGEAIIKSVDASLQRLQTDYIDIYQLHWPNRTSPHFAKHWPGKISFKEADTETHSNGMLEILQALNECIKKGKIRYYGLSDDTPWGINEYLRLSEKHQLPRMVSIQNEFNLLHHKDWPYLLENCIHTEVSFLPWSPLAGGVLSGKYIDGARPPGSRWDKSQRQGLFRDTATSNLAVKAYQKIAQKHHISTAQLALAWCNSIEGVSSTIIGATNIAQLKEDLAAFEMSISDNLVSDIDDVLHQYPIPF